ncbi:hypothetical protein HZA87_01400 [Candidatus Uhrbacteria bacterium]|nr:hypothetical protein [Candidatus Uhrbacteria bacterium]
MPNYFFDTPANQKTPVTQEQYAPAYRASPTYAMRIAAAKSIPQKDEREKALEQAEELTDFDNNMLFGRIEYNEND